MKSVYTVYYTAPVNLNRSYPANARRNIRSRLVSAEDLGSTIAALRDAGHTIEGVYNSVGKKIF